MREIVKTTMLLGLLMAGVLAIVACTKPKEEVVIPADAFTEFAKQLLYEHNYARMKPAEYAEKFIKPWIGKPAAKKGGRDYAKECYDEMKSMKPVGPLTLEEGLCRAAQEWADELVRTNEFNHDTKENTSARISKYYSWRTWGENLYAGEANAQHVMVNLLIDVGVENVGHRRNILKEAFTSVGVGMAQSKAYAYPSCVAIDYAAPR